jgi:hypothetical protein
MQFVWDFEWEIASVVQAYLRAMSPFESILSQLKELEKDTRRYQEKSEVSKGSHIPGNSNGGNISNGPIRGKTIPGNKGPGSRVLSDLAHILQRIVYEITAWRNGNRRICLG